MAAGVTTTLQRLASVVLLALRLVRLGATDFVVLSDALSQEGGCMSPLMQGPMDVNGVAGSFFAAGSGGFAQGDRLMVQHNSGFSLFSRCEMECPPESIAQFHLLGETISFTVDLSQVGCACNLAVYLISSPAYDATGSYSQGSNREYQPPYYCDANMVGGQWCPEIDRMEANNHAFQATAHRFGPATNRHYSGCDRGGCAQNTHNRPGSYGPGEVYTIDARYPFQVETEFLEEGASSLGMRTTLRQQDRQVVLAHESCNRGYMAALSDALKSGMSLRITYWGDSPDAMAWMDKPPCGAERCSGENAGEAVISGITVSQPEHSGLAAPSFGGHSGEQPAASAATQWIPDATAVWQCHLGAGDDAAHQWCALAGIRDGFQFVYYGEQESPCGCWCCKRAAKQGVAAVGDGMLWIVSDPEDPLYGQQVPEDLAADSTRLKRYGDTGVVTWYGGQRFAKRLPQGTPLAPQVVGSATVFMRKFDVQPQLARARLAFGTASCDVVAATIVGAAALAIVAGAAVLASRRLRGRKAESSSKGSVASVPAASQADAAMQLETPGGFLGAGTGTTPMMRQDHSGSPTVPSPTSTWRSASPFFPQGFVDEVGP